LKLLFVILKIAKIGKVQNGSAQCLFFSVLAVVYAALADLVSTWRQMPDSGSERLKPTRKLAEARTTTGGSPHEVRASFRIEERPYFVRASAI